MAACVGEASGNLKDALIETLNHILSPQANIRRQGEEHIKVLEVTEGKIVFMQYQLWSLIL